MFLSNDSLEITGSEFYPSYHGGIIRDHQPVKNQQQQQQQGSSSISTSSTNQTVLEQPGYQSANTDDKPEKSRLPEVNGNVHVEPDVLHNNTTGSIIKRDTEISGLKGKYINVNNNIKANNFTALDKDAYRPRLYSCCSSNEGNNGNEAPVPRDKHLSHDMTSQVVHRKHGSSRQQAQITLIDLLS